MNKLKKKVFFTIFILLSLFSITILTIYNYQNYNQEYYNIKNNLRVFNGEKRRLEMFDNEKKLYYHGYDSERQLFWADKKTGLSKNFWLRSIGWFTVALVDVLDYMDEQMYDEYHTIKELLKEVIDGLLQYQDKDSKMFYQVPNYPGREGNYLETSGSAMISYAIL